MLISICSSGQTMEKSQTARQTKVRQDTINNKVFKQVVFTHKIDSAGLKSQDTTISKLDSLILIKKKK